MDFIKILVNFIKMFGYSVKNATLDNAYGDTNVFERLIRIDKDQTLKDKELPITVLAHETGHMWHFEVALEETIKRNKIVWEVCADLFCIEILNLANEIPSEFIRNHLIESSLSCSITDRRWAAEIALRGVEEFKKFLEKNS